MYKNLLTSKNTCTKEILLKTPNSSSCSKSNTGLALSTTQEQEQEPATNYSCSLHHQSNASILLVNEGASTSINHEHVDCTENSLQSVKGHVLETQLDAKNLDEISSRPNVPAADLPEIPFPIETSNTKCEYINELQNLVAEEFAQNSDSDVEIKKFLLIILELKMMII